MHIAHPVLAVICRAHDRDRGKEEYREGNCKVERKWERNGRYKEERKCEGPGRDAVYAPTGPEVVNTLPPVVISTAHR